jgi:hypothetical protein
MDGLHGEVVGPACPECGGVAVYNGNYFCDDRELCGWALPGPREDDTHPPLPDDVARWGRDAYISLMRSRGQKPEVEACAIEFWR